MSILTRKPKPDPARIYVATTSFGYAGDAPISIHRGDRLRGDNPTVIGTFGGSLWAPDGTPDDELSALWRAANVVPPTTPDAGQIIDAAWQRWGVEETDAGTHLRAMRRVQAGGKLALATDGTLLLDGKALEHSTA